MAQGVTTRDEYRAARRVGRGTLLNRAKRDAIWPVFEEYRQQLSSRKLKEVDDVGGLMDRGCPIRYIITKSALQEGWDCPFAYVLTVLADAKSKTAMTQLVGRVLRERTPPNPGGDL